MVDRLTETYPMVYLVDLDGLERGDPQLDYLQELARETPLWVDGGVRTAEQAIDILVTGARRAVLSSAYLRGPRQLRRAWKLSTELAFELEIDSTGRLVVADAGWETADPVVLARAVRDAGPDHIVLSPRETDPDWELVRSISAGGPTWVDGSFQLGDRGRLGVAQAAGGIFHIDDLLLHWNERPMPTSTLSNDPLPTRDDET